jgi:hypothetical protein
MVGSLRWRGPSGPIAAQGYLPSLTTEWGFTNDFAAWIHGLAGEPGQTAVMNCWEAIFYIAYKAGVLSKSKILEIHNKAAEEGKSRGILAAFKSIARSMYSGNPKKFEYDKKSNMGLTPIPAGNIIFINDYLHVMISKGTLTRPEGWHEVISLWMFPKHFPPDIELGPVPRPDREQIKEVFGVLQNTSVEEIIKTAHIPGAKITFAAPSW